MLLTSLVSKNTRRILSTTARATVASVTSVATTTGSTRTISTNGITIMKRNVTPNIALQSNRTSLYRFFTTSSSSHSDFAPKKKAIRDDDVASIIDSHVKANPVMLYMKGSPSAPQCGFSLKVVQILQKEGIDFASVNVLDYPSIREGIKEYSNWPTIPQLYIQGEFIGGCDIVTDLHTSGELKDLLSQTKKE